MTQICQTFVVPIQTASLLRLCSLLKKTALLLGREPSFLGNSGTINQFIAALHQFRSLFSGPYVPVFYFTQLSWVGHPTPTHLPREKSKNYWRKERLCFLNFMGNPTASSSQNTVKARHCLCCVLVSLLECKSQGSEFPSAREHGGAAEISGFFSCLSQIFPYFRCCSKNGEASSVSVQYPPL